MPSASFRDAGVSPRTGNASSRFAMFCTNRDFSWMTHKILVRDASKFPKNWFPDGEVRDAEERKHQV
jgi:hypothetical protein